MLYVLSIPELYCLLYNVQLQLISVVLVHSAGLVLVYKGAITKLGYIFLALTAHLLQLAVSQHLGRFFIQLGPAQDSELSMRLHINILKHIVLIHTGNALTGQRLLCSASITLH